MLEKKITIDEMDFMLVPAGKFLMGSREDDSAAFGDEKPQHTVELPDYYIGRTPVTNRQFNEFLQDTKINHQWVEGWQKKLDHPVVNVSWQEAVAFCQWYNSRHAEELPAGMALTLPSEAEWEKAARGEFGKEYPWGDEFDAACCNTVEGGKEDTTPVGAYSPQGDSPYGAVDMAGNVWEWCVDWYSAKEYQCQVDLKQPIVNPCGPEEGVVRVTRGGAWSYNRDFARGACRVGIRPGNYLNICGFRVVLSPKSI